MQTEIYYFSGMGNSLFVAKELQKRLGATELIPIAKLLNSQAPIAATTKRVGFVFPCHGLTIPAAVHSFLKKLNIDSAEYIFAIATREDTVFRGFPVIKGILKKSKKALNSSFVINMSPTNPKLATFTRPTAERLAQVKSEVNEKSEIIKNVVEKGESHHDDAGGVSFSKSPVVNYLLERLVPFLVLNISTDVKKYFYIDSKCTGCALCAKLCLSGKIVMKERQPCWPEDKKCYMCYGCLNACPSEAIQIYSQRWMQSHTEKNGRYRHPYVSLEELAGQR